MPPSRKRYYWIQQSIKDESFDSKYALGREIGRGRTSLVFTCERRELNLTFAVKIVKKNLDKKVSVVDIGVLLGLQHENLVRLQEIFESQSRIFIVQELEYGGELFDRLATLSTYTEMVPARAVKDIAAGLNYLHSCGYVLRNLKPENLLYANAMDDSPLLIADFALSSIVGLEVDMSSVCGFPTYTAPEILKGERGEKPGDIWSLGVIMFIMLCGYEPFSSDNPSQLFKQILKGQFEFFPDHWDSISVDAKELIHKLLVVDPATRITSSTLLRSIWVQGSVPRVHLIDDVIERIKHFNERRKQWAIASQQEVHSIHPNINPRFLLNI